MPRTPRPTAPTSAPIRASLRCPVPGCGGMLRPETNGMGRLIEICDRCVMRTQEHARFAGYFRALERRIAALEAALASRASRESDTTRDARCGSIGASVRPRREASAPRLHPIDDALVDPLGVRRTLTRTILHEVRALARPVTIADLMPLVLAHHPESTPQKVRALVYNLRQRGFLVVTERAFTKGAAHFALPSLAAPSPTAAPASPSPLAP